MPPGSAPLRGGIGCSNCVVRQVLGGHGRVPGGLLFAQGIAEDQQLAQTGREGDLGPLPRRHQPPIEGADGRIGARGGEGRHIKHRADGGAAAPDAAAAAPGPAVAIERGDADEGGNLPLREGSEFGELRRQGRAGNGTDPRDAAEPGSAGAQAGIGLQLNGDLCVESGQAVAQPRQVGVHVGAEEGRGQGAPLLLGDPVGEELAPAGDQGVPVLAGGCTSAAKRASTRASSRSVLARLLRRRAKSRTWRGLPTTAGSPAARIAAGGFQHEAGGRPGLRPADEAGVAAGVLATRQASPVG